MVKRMQEISNLMNTNTHTVKGEDIIEKLIYLCNLINYLIHTVGLLDSFACLFLLLLMIKAYS